MNSKILALLVVPLLAPLLVGDPAQDARDTTDLFPTPSGDLEITGPSWNSFDRPAFDQDHWTLMRLIREYSRLTDQHFVIAPDTSTYLEQMTTGGVLEELGAVPKEKLQSVFEHLLVQNQFILQVLRTEPPRMLAVESLQTGGRTSVRKGARFVPAEQIDAYAGHPAILITTVMHLPNSDAQALSSSMSAMVTDRNTQQILHAGESNSMVLTGFGPWVAAIGRILRETDAASAVERSDPIFRRFALEHAQAAAVATTIEELVHATHASSGQEGAAPVADHVDPLIRVDERTNALVVMASPGDMRKVEELVKLFDIGEPR